MTTIWQHCWQC